MIVKMLRNVQYKGNVYVRNTKIKIEDVSGKDFIKSGYAIKSSGAIKYDAEQLAVKPSGKTETQRIRENGVQPINKELLASQANAPKATEGSELSKAKLKQEQAKILQANKVEVDEDNTAKETAEAAETVIG